MIPFLKSLFPILLFLIFLLFQPLCYATEANSNKENTGFDSNYSTTITNKNEKSVFDVSSLNFDFQSSKEELEMEDTKKASSQVQGQNETPLSPQNNNNKDDNEILSKLGILGATMLAVYHYFWSVYNALIPIYVSVFGFFGLTPNDKSFIWSSVITTFLGMSLVLKSSFSILYDGIMNMKESVEDFLSKEEDMLLEENNAEEQDACYNYDEGKYKDFIKSNDVVSVKDVTMEYIDNATPNVGSISFEDGYKKDKRHMNEINMANKIYTIFGGDILLVAESNEENVNSPDYIWNGEKWDLKTVTTSNSSTINSHIKKIHKQTDDKYAKGIIDFTNSGSSMEEALGYVSRAMISKNKVSDDIIVFKEDEFVVLRSIRVEEGR